MLKSCLVALLAVAAALATGFPTVAQQQPAPVPVTVLGGIKGQVVKVDLVTPADKEDAGVPLAGALVIVTDKRGVEFKRTHTDKEGKFTVDVPPGAYNIAVYPKANSGAWPQGVKAKVEAKDPHSNIKVRFANAQ